MSVGALKTLFTTLAASSFLSGVNVSFGEEFIADEQALPFVCIVPIGGQWEYPGYIQGLDPNIEVWSTKEQVDIYCRAASTDPAAQPADHADAVETLRQQVLSALQDQRNQANADGSSAPGLWWKPISGRWVLMNDSINRFGRDYVLTVYTEIGVPMLSSALNEATITSETVSDTITH